MRENAGSRLNDYDILGLVNKALTKIARLDIAKSAFQCTGTYPLNRNLFSVINYLAADMTNIPLEKPGTSTNAPSCIGKISRGFTDLELVANLSTSCDAELSTNMGSEKSTASPSDYTYKPSTSSLKSSTSVVKIVHKLSPLPDVAKKDH